MSKTKRHWRERKSMKPYKNVKVLILDDDARRVKQELSMEEFGRQQPRTCKYLLKVEDRVYPCPVGRHKVVEKDGLKFCDISRNTDFSFESYKFFIGDIKLNPKRSFAIGEEEIFVLVNFRGISRSGTCLPVFCALVKKAKVKLHFFDLFDFRNEEGGVFVVFRPFSKLEEGEYSVDFYIGGRLLFSEKVKFYRLTYNFSFLNT